ncbi:uncharacterized protein LOC142624994 [Castanea sativa]|uniref:uncharacterized protein LOC142624994 n=1 Tax=Castanea sativa TaxID=21020 RepID=UPI003F64C36B
MNGKVDKTVNDGNGPYVFRLNGQNHHLIGSLLPVEGSEPKFDFTYLIQRMSALVKVFRMARDHYTECNTADVRLRLINCRTNRSSQYNLPTALEVAGLIVNDFDPNNGYRDITVEDRDLGLQHISEIHLAFMAMQYPLLFPYGEDDFFVGIPKRLRGSKEESENSIVTMREYYAFRIQQWLSEVVYTIEFQKRGLPHAHILVFLHPDDKEDIDSIISAEIPDSLEDSIGHEAVKQFMMHGPYGAARPNSPCMVYNNCTKHFPKRFVRETIIDDQGFSAYRRREEGCLVVKNSVELENRYVVPYNIDLLVKYQSHLNVEWCNRSKAIKYLSKYINKGIDRVTAVLEENVVYNPNDGIESILEKDKIKTYLDRKYISASKASWRIFQFEIHYHEPAVQRLNFHMKNENQVTFSDYEYLDNVVNRPGIDKTVFTKWMTAN